MTRVIYGVPDPNPVAAGGARWLAEHGVATSTARGAGLPEDAVALAERLVDPWATVVRRRRAWVIGKAATSLDGRVAAVDGTSMWITGPVARAHAHTVRADVDAIVVGTGTVLTDDPALTARRPDGTLHAHQPLRIVVGERPVPAGAAIRRAGGWRHAATRDIAAVLAGLWDAGVRRVLLEGGPTILAAALRAELVDELHAYVAPILIGRGPSAVPDFGVTTLGQAPRWHTTETHRLGDDVLVVARRPQGGN